MEEKDSESLKFYNTPFAPFGIISNDAGGKQFLDLAFKKGDFKEKITIIVPLSYFNYELELDKEILNKLNLIKIPPDFIGYKAWAKGYCNNFNWADYAFVKEINYSQVRLSELESGMGIAQFSQEPMFPPAMNELDVFLLSLRLFKPQHVWYDSILPIYEIKDKKYNILFWANRYMGGSTAPFDGYKLKTEDLEAFYKLREFVNVNYIFFTSDKHLKIALSFFEASYFCVPTHQKFVNLIIALEAILISDEKQEITNKICLRLATLISQKGRLSLYNDAKRLFKIRGKIVHGSFVSDGVAPAKDETFRELYNLRVIASFCLINYVKLLQNKLNNEEIIKLLDESILNEEKNISLKKMTTDTFPFFDYK